MSDLPLEARHCERWQNPDHWDCGDPDEPCPLMRSGIADLVARASGPVSRGTGLALACYRLSTPSARPSGENEPVPLS